MTVIWCADTPLTSTEILKRSGEKTWSDNSLHTILNKLLLKGAIKEHGFIKDGNIIARTFVPVLSCEDYYEKFFEAYPSTCIPMIFSAIMRRTDFDTETLNKMESIIREKRTEMDKAYSKRLNKK